MTDEYIGHPPDNGKSGQNKAVGNDTTHIHDHLLPLTTLQDALADESLPSLPVLAALCVAREAVSEQWLATHTGETPHQIDRVLQRWHPFLKHEQREKRRLWQIGHPSLTDVLVKQTAADIAVVQQKICVYYWDNPAHWSVNDGYAYRHLSHHMRDACDHDGLFALMDSRAWRDAQLTYNEQGTTYRNDLAQAWSMAEAMDAEAARHGQVLPLLGREVRCALATANLRRPTDDAAVFPSEHQPGDQVHVATPHDLDHQARATILARLVPHLDGKAFSEALDTMRAFEQPSTLPEVLWLVSRHLAEVGRLEESHLVANTITDPWRHVQALADVLPHLPEAERGAGIAEVLRAAQGIEAPANRIEMLAVVVRSLSEAEQHAVLEEILNLSQAIAAPVDRFEGLKDVLPHLIKAGWFEQALHVTLAIEDASIRSWALGDIVHHLAEDGQVVEALRVARMIERSWYRSDALFAVLPYLAEAQQNTVIDEVLSIARTLDDPWTRLQALLAVISRLAEAARSVVIDEALRTTHAIASCQLRSEALCAIVPYLAQIDRIDEALRIARALDDPWRHLQTLLTVLPYRIEAEQEAGSRELVHIARGFAEPWTRSQALATIFPHLTAAEQGAVIEELLSSPATDDSPSYSEIWHAVVPYLAGIAQVEEILRISHMIDDSLSRSQVLFAVVQCSVDATHIDLALHLTRAIEDVSYRYHALRVVILHLLKVEQGAAFEEALDVVRKFSDPWHRIEALVDMIPHLPEGDQSIILHEALHLARMLDEPWSRAMVLRTIVHYLTKAGQLEEACQIAQTIDESDTRTDALREVVQHLVAISSERFHPVWCTTLRHMATRSHRQALEDLGVLVPVIARFGGVQSITDVAHTIINVGLRP